MNIKRASLKDINSLQKIGKRTFLETFSTENSEQDMAYYLEENFSFKKLTNELTEINSEFYFVEMEGKVVGYLKVNFGEAQTENKKENSMEIERIYVSKEFQGKKVGKALFNKAVLIAKEKKVSYVWLGVWERNTKAINFYVKNGFKAFGKHIFVLGNDPQTDIMMKLKLN